MYQEISFSEFHDQFMSCRPENFSYEGLRLLFDYLVQYEEDTSIKIELDVIAICCDYSEDSIKNVLENYSLESLEELERETIVLKIDDENIIYQNY